MNSKMVLGQYYNSNSWVHRLDPRLKIIALFVYMIAIFLVDNIYSLLCFLGFTLIIVFTTKVPFIKFLNNLLMLVYVFMFMFIFQVLFRKTGTLLVSWNFTLTVFNLVTSIVLLVLFFLSNKIIKKCRFLIFMGIIVGSFVLQYYYKVTPVIANYHIDIYDDSLNVALFVLIRIVAIIFTSALLTLTTKPIELNQGLEKLLSPLKLIKLNPAVFCMMVSIALRFIPTLINEANKILRAQASRGVDFQEGNFSQKIKQVIALIVPMFAIAYRKAIDLADAMEARGYDPDSKRTSMEVLHFRFVDYFCLIFINLLLVAIILLKIFIPGLI